jgi:DNA ligase-1
MELDGSRYRTMSGLLDGKQAVSGWSQATAASQANDEDQAMFEVRAKYQHQLDREYRRSVGELGDVKNEFVEPMLAKTYTDFPGPGFSQPKLDGIRCIAKAEGLFSRQGQPIIAVPHIHAALAPLFEADPDLILDGELYNHDLRDDFGAISSIVRKKNPTPEQLEKAEAVMQYHVYDIIDADPEATFGYRTTRVKTLLDMLDCSWIVPVETILTETKDEATIAYGNFVEEGYEGGMFRLDKPYELGRRSKALLKRKEFITEEFPVTALVEGNGNWAGAVKRVELVAKNGKPFGAGIRGSHGELAKLLGDKVGPDAEATVRYFMLSPDGIPRFPVVIDYHPNGRKD